MKKSADTEDTAAGNSLSAYLHSHLTAASAGERLFEQAAKSWRDTAHAGEVGRLAAEVSEDKRALETAKVLCYLAKRRGCRWPLATKY